MSGAAALQAYRALLKQIRDTFKRDDLAIRVLSQEVRTHFQAHKGLTSPKDIQKHLADAEEARLCIEQNIVQAAKTGCGNYAVRPEDAQRLRMMAPELPPRNAPASG